MLKKVLIFMLLLIVSFTFRLEKESKADFISSQFTVTTSRPRFTYYNDLFDNNSGLNLVITSNKELPTENDRVATIEFVDTNGRLRFIVDTVDLDFIYSGVDTIYNATLIYDFDTFAEDILSDIDEANINFYRVRINDIVLYTGAFIGNTNIDNSEATRVEFGYYPYNTSADYDSTKQYQFTTGVQDNILILHYKCVDADVATKSINFYDISTGIVDYTIDLDDIMEAQLSYDFGAIEPDPFNVNVRNSFIPLSLDGELLEPLRVNINGVNDQYEDLLNNFNLGVYGIYIGTDDLITIDNVASAVWFNTNNAERSVFDLVVTPDQVKIDSDNSLKLEFIQDTTYISDYYVTNDLILESTEFDNFISILGGRDLDQYQGNFTLDYDVNNDYPVDAEDTITWIIEPTNMDNLGVTNAEYLILLSTSYNYQNSKDIAGSLYNGFSFFGLKNETGGIVLIVISMIIGTILLAWVKVSLPVYLISYVIIVAIFTMLGLSTMWFNITFGLIVIIGFSVSMRREE